jgi:hypothetical protein
MQLRSGARANEQTRSRVQTFSGAPPLPAKCKRGAHNGMLRPELGDQARCRVEGEHESSTNPQTIPAACRTVGRHAIRGTHLAARTAPSPPPKQRGPGRGGGDTARRAAVCAPSPCPAEIKKTARHRSTVFPGTKKPLSELQLARCCFRVFGSADPQDSTRGSTL